MTYPVTSSPLQDKQDLGNGLGPIGSGPYRPSSVSFKCSQEKMILNESTQESKSEI